MLYRRLGKSGLQVSVFSFGSWVSFNKQINDKRAEELMGMAYEAGINFFDNADRVILDKDPFYANQIQVKCFDLVPISETLSDRLSALRTRRETDLADGLLTLILSIHPLVHFFYFDPVVAFQINVP